MSTAIAIIGSNFGDEGKGAATDYFARAYTLKDSAPLVARCNGGAQAGHTVKDGKKKHVFGHIGAGALAGSDTYLAQNFIINPFVLEKEMAKLISLVQFPPMIYAHRDCRITTMYDMALNSLAELMREGRRHGSCGLGINETVTRHRAGHFLTIGHLMNQSPHEVAHRLKLIHDEWVPQRLKELEIFPDKFPENVKKKMGVYFSMLSADRMDMAMSMRLALRDIRLDDPKVFNNNKQNMVIEGAQGLMLDEFLGEFPHVTRSVTGLAAHVQAAYECGYTSVKPVYITRSYLTRHGNGALHNEGEVITSTTPVCETNITNEWQGNMRYAPLDLDALKSYITEDYARGVMTAQMCSAEINEPSIFITCMDQLGDNVQINIGGQLDIIPSATLLKVVEDYVGIKVEFVSYGPEAKDVRVV